MIVFKTQKIETARKIFEGRKRPTQGFPYLYQKSEVLQRFSAKCGVSRLLDRRCDRFYKLQNEHEGQ
jgi:hypothetical protein